MTDLRLTLIGKESFLFRILFNHTRHAAWNKIKCLNAMTSVPSTINTIINISGYIFVLTIHIYIYIN